jgi:glucose-1-phosphate cytidylyltransferase
MKLVILAGGRGTRLMEYTKTIPKPMVPIHKKPIITYIINHYYKFGVREVIIAAGYKYLIIKKFFKKKNIYNDLKVKVINTGLNTLTGLRVQKLKFLFSKKENFYLTYGDGVCDVDLNKLLNFHLKHKKIATLTAVHPPARFGELKIKNNKIIEFNEKPQLTNGWINGGFFIFNYKIFNFLNNKNVMLERDPIQKIINKKNFMAFKHNGFWMCMDTVRDKALLEKIIKK